MQKHWALLAAMITAVVGAGGYWLGAATSGNAEHERPHVTTAAKPKIQIRTVERIVEREPMRLAEPKVTVEPASTEDDGFVEEDYQTGEEAQYQARVNLDARFASQGTDRLWAGNMEGTIGDALRSVLPTSGLRLESVECRSDLCVSTLTHDTARPSQDVIMAFLLQAIPGLETRIIYDDGVTMIYSIRRDDALAQAQ